MKVVENRWVVVLPEAYFDVALTYNILRTVRCISEQKDGWLNIKIIELINNIHGDCYEKNLIRCLVIDFLSNFTLEECSMFESLNAGLIEFFLKCNQRERYIIDSFRRLKLLIPMKNLLPNKNDLIMSLFDITVQFC